jgi:FAD binding domain
MVDRPREERGVTGIEVDQLRGQVGGDVVAPGDEGYDEARRVYNAMIDRRPAVVVRCSNAGDVVAAVNFARENELDLAVRGGSHSVPGFGTCADCVVIDLSGMRRVSVDATKRTARAEGAPRGAISTTRRTPTAWPRPAASSRRRGSGVSRSAEGSATSPAGSGSRATTWSPPTS